MSGYATTSKSAPRIELLSEAIELTGGDRNEAYGDPVLNHQHIADIFNAVTGRNLSAREIVLVHVATKLARRARNPTHRDSYVDGMAYTGIEYECALHDVMISKDRTDVVPDCEPVEQDYRDRTR